VGRGETYKYDYSPGTKYGKLTIVKWERPYVICDCDCGNKGSTHHSRDVSNGNTKSCGCLASGAGASNFNHRHGQCRTRVYRIWCAMKSRCYNEKVPHYKHYGGRGITICEEWLGPKCFEVFQSWALANGYKKHLSIDRIDNDKGYSPANCRWATQKEQTNNQRPMRSTNTSGFKGVYATKSSTSPWNSRYKGKYIGCYKTAEDANEAYLLYLESLE